VADTFYNKLHLYFNAEEELRGLLELSKQYGPDPEKEQQYRFMLAGVYLHTGRYVDCLHLLQTHSSANGADEAQQLMHRCVAKILDLDGLPLMVYKEALRVLGKCIEFAEVRRMGRFKRPKSR
jgi:hypothetical protein